MAAIQRSKTLFEAVPALGTISAHGSGMARLVPVDFEHPGIELAEGVNRVGRDPSAADLVISSSHVSRSHCEILFSAGKIWVTDLESHNGTFINGIKIIKSEVKPGDKLGLSRRITFVLAMDADMVQPIGLDLDLDLDRDLDLDNGRAEMEPPSPAAISGPGTQPGWSSGAPVVSVLPAEPASDLALQHDKEDSAELDQDALIKQLEQQRNVLAILYQISLHCLRAGNIKEIEELLTNVLQRLVPLDSGFILYRASSRSWRASICPTSTGKPTNSTVRAFYKLAQEHRDAMVLRDPGELASLGVQSSSAIMVPLISGEEISGVVGAISNKADVYSAEIVDVVKQLANISAAALRGH